LLIALTLTPAQPANDNNAASSSLTGRKDLHLALTMQERSR